MPPFLLEPFLDIHFPDIIRGTDQTLSASCLDGRVILEGYAIQIQMVEGITGIIGCRLYFGNPDQTMLRTDPDIAEGILANAVDPD